MEGPESKPPTEGERRLLRGLFTGFAAVIGLLGLTGLFATRGSSRIQDEAAQLAREQRLVTRLFRGVEHEQAALSAVLRHLAQPAPDRQAGHRLLAQLEAGTADLMQIAEQGRASLPDAPWAELRLAVERFRADARRLLQAEGAYTAAELAGLFVEEQRVATLFSQLLESRIDHLNAHERDIERQSHRLASTSAALVGAGFVLSVVCAVASLRGVRSNIRRIEWQADALNTVSWHMLGHQEAAARRFAHELHDELGQSLAAVRAAISRTSNGLDPDVRNNALQQVDSAIANVRDLSQLLRPVVLDDLGLEPALRWLVEGFSERTGIRAEFTSQLGRRLPDTVETHVFRIAQEALTNIARHSHATRFTMDLRLEHDELVLVLEDNGIGLQSSRNDPKPSLGVIGMQARARQCAGELRLEPAHGHGLRLVLRIPAPPADANSLPSPPAFGFTPNP